MHWADTAEDARRIVAEIATSRGVRHGVKSKSMVSEEIELNGALEAAGVRVVETDLGEFVVQVGGEHPSHIIAPILHKSKEDVAELFERKLGATDEDVADVPHMAAFARRAAARRVPPGRHGRSAAELRRGGDRAASASRPTKATAA